MIISVHIPKTAGTSFGLALKDKFGERLKPKYGDRLFNMPVFERNKKALLAAIDNSELMYENMDCIHGHFYLSNSSCAMIWSRLLLSPGCVTQLTVLFRIIITLYETSMNIPRLCNNVSFMKNGHLKNTVSVRFSGMFIRSFSGDFRSKVLILSESPITIPLI